MKVLLAPTENLVRRNKAAITADVAAGATTVLVPQTVDFDIDYAVLGEEGSDTAEIVQVMSGDGINTLTISATINKHYADEPITGFRYNQRKFYGSLLATGPFVELTGDGSPVDINVSDKQGTLLEYAGGEGYIYFKATYYDQTSSEESNIADANAVLANEAARYCSIYAIRKQGGLTNNPYITDGFIETYRKRAENEVNSYLNARYILPLINSTGVLEIPWMVENVTVLLAAGYMDYQQLGAEGDGKKWLGEARSILKQLQTPAGQQLLGSDNAEMQTKNLSNGVISNETESGGDDCGDEPYFSRQQIF